MKHWIAIGLLLGCAPLLAQRPGRSFDTFADGGFLGVDARTAEWSISYSGKLTCISTVDPVFADTQSVIVVPGALHVLSGQDVLIAGRDAAGQGVIQHWQSLGYSLSLVSSATFPTLDVAGVVYDPAGSGTLYVLDSVGQRILKGTWNPPTSLSGVTLTQWVGTTQVADLAFADERTIAPEPSGGVRLMYWPFLENVAGVVVQQSGSSIVLGSYSCTGTDVINDVWVDELTASEAGTSVRVVAPSGVAFEVLDTTVGGTVGTGVGGSTGSTTITISPPLVIGNVYVARRTGQPVSGERGFTCVRRYGYPETFSDGTHIRGMYFQLGAGIGQTFFVEAGLKNEAAPLAADIAYQGMMLIGIRVGSPDPIVPYGSNQLLASGAYLPAKGFVSSRNGWGLAYSSIAIPNDPGLVGLVFFVQFAMEDGLDYRLSEVYGALIEGSPMETMAAMNAGPGVAEFAGAVHLQGALLEGQVLNAAPQLIQILPRRQ
jgi:hypothetical protein